MTPPVSLTGGQVLMPDGSLRRADVHIADGHIVNQPAQHGTTVDCRGYYVLPGIVDVHGDAFELDLHPRPGVDIAFPIALGSVDRQLVFNGITTAFHGLTVSWEPGARSLEAARQFMTGLAALRPNLAADHRVQLRWETFAHDAIDDISGWLRGPQTPALAFNDHTTATLETVKSGTVVTLEKWAHRAGVTLEQYLDAVAKVARRQPDVAAKIGVVAALARRHGAVMLAHDESTPQQRALHRDLGIRLCEFPLTAEVAMAAQAQGEPVVLGGPNALRGTSHKGMISAEDAVRDGQCTVLASDYYYPSLFHAAERLVKRGVVPFDQAWALVSANPAKAMRLMDRGTIEPNRRADLVVVDCATRWRIVQTVIGGQIFRVGS